MVLQFLMTVSAPCQRMEGFMGHVSKISADSDQSLKKYIKMVQKVNPEFANRSQSDQEADDYNSLAAPTFRKMLEVLGVFLTLELKFKISTQHKNCKEKKVEKACHIPMIIINANRT